MAEGYASLTGQVGVAMATRGVGAANISIAVHTAFQDSTPMVVFLGQVNRSFKGREGSKKLILVRTLMKLPSGRRRLMKQVVFLSSFKKHSVWLKQDALVLLLYRFQKICCLMNPKWYSVHQR